MKRESGAHGYGKARLREARLRPEFAVNYPYLTAGIWESAAVLSDRVVANILGRPDGRFISTERALDPLHFEFRGNEAQQLAGPRRREEV
jgi:hypothetical protein